MAAHNHEKGTRRRKGTGSLILRGNVWYAKWTYNGVTHVQSTGIRATSGHNGNNIKKAEAWLMDKTEPLRIRHKSDGISMLIRQLQTEEERLADAIREGVGRADIGDLEKLFRDSPRRRDCSAQMLERYCGVVRRLAKDVGENVSLADFGIKDAEDYARKLSKQLSPNSYNKALNALTLVWSAVICTPECQKTINPWKEIARRRLDTFARRAFTREETDRILDSTKGEMKTLVAVCLYTGLRLGDACRIKWENIRGNSAFVLTAKRDRMVGIPIHPRLDEILGMRKKEGYVMPGIAGIYERSASGAALISRRIKRVMEKCGIKTSETKNGKWQRSRPYATAHSLRHTFITRAIEAGVPPHAVQAIVGHASATMTEHYTHLSDKAIIDAFSNMD